jgi:hypothetical protein
MLDFQLESVDVATRWQIQKPCGAALKLAVGLALIAAAGGLARGSLPPAFAVQQQDRAVRAYCAEWRNARGKLAADEMNRRVIVRLEQRYPTVFPDCRPGDRRTCLGWVNALVEGLRRYGRRSLRSVCAEFQEKPETP